MARPDWLSENAGLAEPAEVKRTDGVQLLLDPATIDPDIDGRIGLFFPAKAEAIGLLMEAHGQHDAIKVRRAPSGSAFAWILVYGLHRLEGARQRGIQVLAIEAREGDDFHRLQASENMDRRELAPLERAMFVAAVADAAQRRLEATHGTSSQQAIAGRARQAKVQYSDAEKADDLAKAAVDNLSIAYGWKAETAEACGLGPKDVQRNMRIFRCVIEPNRDLMDAFKDHPVAQKASELLEIAALRDAILRRKVIETLITGPKELDYVLRMLGIRQEEAAPNPYAKFTSQILGGWDRLSTAQRRRFIPDLAQAIPAGMRTLLREELERLGTK